jgi:Skp family chaperone for outer membrane proteins
MMRIKKMRLILNLVGLSILISLLTAPLYSQENAPDVDRQPLKIGVFDLDRVSGVVIQEMPSYRKFNLELDEAEAVMKVRKEALDKLKGELNTLASALSDEAIAKRQKEIASSEDSLKKNSANFKQKFETKFQETIQPINNKIEELIIQWIEEQQYDLIIEPKVIYFSSDRIVDLTQKVIDSIREIRDEIDPQPMEEEIQEPGQSSTEK